MRNVIGKSNMHNFMVSAKDAIRSLRYRLWNCGSQGPLSANAVVGELERLLFAPGESPDLHALEAVVWRGAPRASFNSDIEKLLPYRLGWSLPTREVLRLIRCFVPEGAAIVDVGAGTGLWMRVLRFHHSPDYYRVSGFDSKPQHDCVAEQSLSAWRDSGGLPEPSGLLIVSWPQFCPGSEKAAFDDVLHKMPVGQHLLYISQGTPFGATACPIFTKWFHTNFDLLCFEPMPRIHRGDPSRAYAWLFQRSSRSYE